MKKIIITIFTLFLFVVAASSQGDDIEKFWKDINALAGDGVECEAYDVNSYIKEQFISQLRQQLGDEDVEQLMEHFPVIGKGGKLLLLETDGEEGYRRVCSFVEKYEIDATEELFGIPLMINSRDEGEQQIVFSNDDYTLIFNDEAEDCYYEVCIATCNIIDLLQEAMLSVMEVMDETLVDVLPAGNEKLAYTLSADGEVTGIALADAVVKKTVKKNSGPLYNDSIIEPALVQNGDGDYRVAIPTLTDEDKIKAAPYAVSGIYDWINETGFGKGGGENPHQKSGIITPLSVLKEYFRANNLLPLSVEHPSAGFCKHFTAEYQGGVPAVLYRKSLTPEGYDDALSDLAPFFALENGARYRNMKVVNRYDSPAGERFVQLYGENCVLVCIYDSPTEKRCCMSVTLGDNDAFASFLKAYRFDGESDIVGKCRIEIGDNGIHFSAGNLINPRGVYFNLDYYNRINHKQ